MHHVISHLVSFFFLSQSFFIDKEENLLCEYIVLSFILVYTAVYFAWSRKKREVHSIVSLFASSVSLLKKMRKCNLNFHNKHSIHGKLRLIFKVI